MDLSLDKKKYEYCKKIYSGSVVNEENTEIIVPDQSPDISRIVCGRANVFIKEKNTREDKIDISGNVKGVVLYIAENEKNVRRIEITLPFVYLIDCDGVTSESKLIVDAQLRSVDVREINPRKVSVRASVELNVSVFEDEEISVCEKITDSEELGVRCRMKNISSYQPTIINEKSFNISDDIELSSAENDMCDIIFSSVRMVPSETKIIGNKAIVKGTIYTDYIYTLPDEQLECGEHELPFSQIIDVDGMNENDYTNVRVSVCGYELEPQYDAAGKARYIAVNVSATANTVVYSQKNIELLDDAYSTKYHLQMKRDKVKYTELHNKTEKRVSVNETIEAGTSVKKVLDVSVTLLPIARRREEGGEVIASDALLSVIYIGEDDLVYSASRRAVAVCPIPLNDSHVYSAFTEVRGKSYSLGANNEINVRFFTDFEIDDKEECVASTVSDMSIDIDNPKQRDDIPGVIVKRLEHDSEVWTLAKEYSTTVEEIKLANSIMDDSMLLAGRMILIPKKA